MTTINPNPDQYHRQTEPPTLWVIFTVGSVSLHLLAFGILHLLVGTGKTSDVASTAVSVEIITAKPINKASKRQVTTAKPVQPAKVQPQVESTPSTPPSVDTSDLNSKFPVENVPPKLEQQLKTVQGDNPYPSLEENSQPSPPRKSSSPKPSLKTQKSSSRTSPQARQQKVQKKRVNPKTSNSVTKPSSPTNPRQKTQQQTQPRKGKNTNPTSTPSSPFSESKNSPLASDSSPQTLNPYGSGAATTQTPATSGSGALITPTPSQTPPYTDTPPRGDTNSSPLEQGSETQASTPTSDSNEGGILIATLLHYKLANGGRDNPDEPAKPKQNKIEFSSISYPSQTKQNTNQPLVIQAVLQIDDVGTPTVQSARLLQEDNTVNATQLATEIVQDWKFQPAQQAGQAVYSLLEVTIRIAPKTS